MDFGFLCVNLCTPLEFFLRKFTVALCFYIVMMMISVQYACAAFPSIFLHLMVTIYVIKMIAAFSKFASYTVAYFAKEFSRFDANQIKNISDDSSTGTRSLGNVSLCLLSWMLIERCLIM